MKRNRYKLTISDDLPLSILGQCRALYDQLWDSGI